MHKLLAVLYPPSEKNRNNAGGLISYGVVCLNALFFGYLSAVAPRRYEWLAVEDSWVENLTAVWLLLAGFLLFTVAWTERSSVRRGVYVLGGLALLFGAGEEISWGQRIFGLATPDFLLDLNAQRELNVHNINVRLFDRIYREGSLLLSLVACAAFCCRKDRLFGIPLPSILLMLGFLVMLSQIAQPRIDDFVFVKEKQLLLFFTLFTLFSGQFRLFIAAAATWTLVVTLSYVDWLNERLVRHIDDVSEVREYLFGMVCLAYACELWWAQRGDKLPFRSWTPFAGLQLPTVFRGNAEFPRAPWLVVPALVIVGSVGLVPLAHSSYAKTEKQYTQLIKSSEPLVRSHFDVYLDQGRLLYVKELCSPDATGPPFFVHVVPVEQDDLPARRRQYGFDNLDFDFSTHRLTLMSNGHCMAVFNLPFYPIAEITTGQYIPGEGVIWQGVIPLNDKHYIQFIQSRAPVVRSHFDVYLDLDKRRLLYFKKLCGPDDTGPRFFVHIDPVDGDDLPAQRRQHGFDNLDFDFSTHRFIFMNNGYCMAVLNLPVYPIAEIRTGQYIPGEGGIWQGVIPLNDKQYIQFIQSRAPVVRSHFDIYLDLDKRRLLYVKKLCGPDDTGPRFFVHIEPVDGDDLPAQRRQHGFDNLDFDFSTHRLVSNEYCMAVRDLPVYPIAEIRTGQYIPGEGQIWQGVIPLNEK